MKKIISLAVVFALASVSSFAATGTLTMGNGNNSEKVQLSNNVDANYTGTDGTEYGATTYNPKGNGKAYLVTSTSGATFVKANTGSSAPAATTSTSGWTAL